MESDAQSSDMSDKESVSDSGSVLTQNSDPFTQEQVNALRGFISDHAEIKSLQSKAKEVRKNMNGHKTVLIELMQARKKNKLKVGDAKIELQTKTVTKKPNGNQIFEIVENTLRADHGDATVFERIGAKIRKSIQESEKLSEKHDLVLDDGKTKKQRKQ